MTRAAEITDATSDYREWGVPEHGRFYDVTVEAPGVDGHGASISLDGVPMKGVKRWAVEVGLDEANLVTVTFIAASVNRKDRSA